MASIKEDLAGPGVELRETHISWVFLTGEDVWKVKKPVSLGFLDFSTADRRREACEAEVLLNRRMAAGVYLGVHPVRCDASGRHRIDGEGETVDWCIHMKRLPDDDRADVRLESGRLELRHVELLARRLAAFHAEARADDETARFGKVDAIRVNVRENFEQSRESVRALLDRDRGSEIEAWQTDFLDARASLFEKRIRDGRVRDGHGDLRLEQIYVSDRDEVTVLDCVEFNERFRYADVCADVAFLSMDLAWRRRVDLAERFLAVYARESNDYDLYPLVDFYQSYRAYVRGKVASMLAADVDADYDARRRAADEARRYFLLALASERAGVLPQSVVAVGGIIGSGKSTVAEQMAAELTTAVVDSDRTRKHLLGVAATEPVQEEPWQGAYSPEYTDRVYGEVLRRAAAVLDSGRPVVLDASFSAPRHRLAARELASRYGAPFYFIECRADIERCRRRLMRRAAGASVSDGRAEILDQLAAAWEPVEEIDDASHLVLDTAQPLDRNIDALRRQLSIWPPGMVG